LEQSFRTLAEIPGRMCEAWNRGDAAAFFTDFADDGVLIEFFGSVTRGREVLVEGQAPAFDTVLKGSRLLDSTVDLAELVAPGVGVVHHRATLLFAGQTEPVPSSYLMQLYVAHWRDDRWQIVTLHNARVVSFEGLAKLDA
jgi:uncharacterized protein (TIGR02246 family)